MPSRRPCERRCVPQGSRLTAAQPTHDRWPDRIRRCRPRRTPARAGRRLPPPDNPSINCPVSSERNSMKAGATRSSASRSQRSISSMRHRPINSLDPLLGRPGFMRFARAGAARRDQAPVCHCQWWLGRWHAKCRSTDGRADRACRRSLPKEGQVQTTTGLDSVASRPHRSQSSADEQHRRSIHH